MNALLTIIIFATGLPTHSIVTPYQTIELCEVGKDQVAAGVSQTLRRTGSTQVAVSLTCTVISEKDDDLRR